MGTSATIVFCTRYSLDSSGDLEVNFLESLITMDIDLSAGFSVQAFDVTPKHKRTTSTRSCVSVPEPRPPTSLPIHRLIPSTTKVLSSQSVSLRMPPPPRMES